MSGYNTANGYMGKTEDGYMLFSSEADYIEYMEEA